MKQYSRQFIEEIINHLDPKITSFFNQKKNVMNFGTNDLVVLVNESLITNFKGLTLKEDLVPIITTIKKTRNRRKSRWYDSYVNNINNMQYSDPKHPLAQIISLARILPIDKYAAAFGFETVEEIIQDKLEKALIWKTNVNSFFIEFPGIDTQSDKTIFKVLKIDIALDAWRYIYTELNGNVNSFLVMYPDSLVDKPLFGPTAITMIMQNAGKDLLKEIIKDEDNKTVMEVEVSKGKFIPPTTLEPFDFKLLTTVIANTNGSTFYKDRTVTMNMNELARGIVNYNPGTRVFNKIRNTCEKLVAYHYSYVVDEHNIFFNLFDHIDIDTEKKQATFMFSEILSNAIIQEKLITIASPAYNVLQNALSIIICSAMKREQIYNQDSLVGDYSYAFFQKIVRFKSSNKKTNIKLLSNSLQEFVNNKLIIKSFKVSSVGLFTIEFLELSKAELEDLERNTKEIIDGSR